MGALNRLRRQLFTKLLLIFFATGVSLIVLLVISISLINGATSKPFDQFQKNLNQYSNYLIEDIGLPPRQQRLSAIHSTTGMDIYIEGDKDQWLVGDLDATLLKSFHYRALEPDTNIATARRHGYGVIRVDEDHYRYYFVLQQQQFRDNWWIILVSSAAIVILVIGIAYRVVRRLFRPIQELQAASQQVAGGNRKIVVATRSQDELGDLTRSFNTMVARLNELILSKDQLLLDVSHELRSPLTRIRIALEMLEDNKATGSIKDDVALLEQLITEILESSRLEHDQADTTRERIDLGELLHSVCHPLEHFPPGIDLRADNQPITVEGNSIRLAIAFRNIIENGLKFSEDQPRPVEVETRRTANTVLVTVRDFGIGISEQALQTIFEPFSRLDTSRNHSKPGFGLGLNIAQKIIAGHGGSITVHTHGGSMTEFEVCLPAHARQPRPAAPDQAPGAPH